LVNYQVLEEIKERSKRKKIVLLCLGKQNALTQKAYQILI
jgi:hypothetical protein